MLPFSPWHKNCDFFSSGLYLNINLHLIDSFSSDFHFQIFPFVIFVWAYIWIFISVFLPFPFLRHTSLKLLWTRQLYLILIEQSLVTSLLFYLWEISIPRSCCSYKQLLLFYFEHFSAYELGKLAVTNLKYVKGSVVNNL